MKTETVNPNIGNFIDSLREIGYSPEVAVSDLIDNSISADATSIEILTVAKPNIIFAMLDNGKGMTENELVEAMRLASKSPNEERDKYDLGRFGLGLKTASFSQCKKLTVITKKERHVFARQWDLGFIADKNEWLLITPPNLSEFPLFDGLEKRENGTLIIWQDIDKIPSDNFSETIDKLRKHISLVFHKFLEGSVSSKKIKIIVNNNPIKPFNPFNTNHPATQQIASEKINIFGSTVMVQPFILPHHSKLSKQEYDLYATEEGYIKSQGFYLYRQNRIIIYGTWWGMHKAADAHKLVRIKIDIPNSMDIHWGIDIKKSVARPSEYIRNDLKRIISRVIEKGMRPYSIRGRKIEDKTTTQFWEIIATNNKIRFAINALHPLYCNLINDLNKRQRDYLLFYLKGLEAYLPLDAIQASLQRDPLNVDQQQALSEKEISDLVKKLKESNINEEFLQELLRTEIFKNRKEMLNND
ncbi:ATP-binding protein [uncultured Sphingobacterium sp.]|uniref:ATP-binding protein n=1 Tax=uncultured Sphingobacterium sp. TaxID=182688 RepID=UPI0025F7E4A0|nr:ATP-binding protein [uncultured Sphingobacterium sp.]